ncbi:lipid-A-disaccharide synthase [Falsigemmobacter intermedius]|uniref:Lipid-A-disaccharide synthase n=1 Tax=Falsigemmobacter intermedius TaxID=1553448 RepID=A0A444M9L5_9RHOB|nr:lipid-A-disaccharide synthase [Falsigemmobacter intermedius]RWY39605.1 lipid-A-disaccharide synthase [Falsigemmobacter intermedius]
MRPFLIAGEASGDKLGAALMAGLTARLGPLPYKGVGGPLMEAEGMVSLFPMEELSIMGIAEVLPKYFHLKRRIAETAQAVLDSGADLLITIDSPDFCLRVAKLVRAARPEFRTVHYVAPSVWAWRPGRAKKMAPLVDHVLALLPFEPVLMEAAGMSCDFVGHPVVAERRADADDVAALRAKYGLAAPWLLALPGSRRGEVTRLAPVIGETLSRLDRPVQVVLPTVRGVEDLVRDLSRNWPIEPLILTDGAEKRAAFAGAAAAIAASGTVSLELAANAVPMVIAYDMSMISRMMLKTMLKIDTVTLVNLVSETRVIPEFLGADCRAEKIAPALNALLSDGAQRQAQLDAMRLTMERLGQGGLPPGERAAESVIGYYQRPRQIQPPPSTRVLSGA